MEILLEYVPFAAGIIVYILLQGTKSHLCTYCFPTQASLSYTFPTFH